MNRQFDRRFVEMMLGIFLVMLAFAGASADFGWLLGLAGMYLLYRQFSQSRGELNSGQRRASPRFAGRRATDDDLEPHFVKDRATGTQVYAHALEAVRRAGIDPAETPVMPVDVGVMAFSGDQQPSLHRTRPVFDDVDYVQPYVTLRLATRAAGKVRFEIFDSDGQAIFIHEDYHQLKPGENLISPPARLPIHDAQAMHGPWSLRVSADGVVLAEHRFTWAESTEKIIRRHVQVDGELSNEMRQMLEDSRPEKISLDDLLSAQDEEVQRQQTRR